MNFSKILAFVNDLIKSHGLSLTVLTILLGIFMWDTKITNIRNLNRINELEVKVERLNEWRVEELKEQRTVLIETLTKNTELLTEIKEKLYDN